MLKVGKFHSFRRACQTGDLNLAEDLYAWSCDADKQLMIRARLYEAFGKHSKSIYRIQQNNSFFSNGMYQQTHGCST